MFGWSQHVDQSEQVISEIQNLNHCQQPRAEKSMPLVFRWVGSSVKGLGQELCRAVDPRTRVSGKGKAHVVARAGVEAPDTDLGCRVVSGLGGVCAHDGYNIARDQGLKEAEIHQSKSDNAAPDIAVNVTCACAPFKISRDHERSRAEIITSFGDPGAVSEPETHL